MSKVFKAVGNAVGGVVKAVGSVVKGVVNAVAGVVSGVINFVVSPFLGLFGLGAPSMPDVATPDSIKGVMVQREGSDQHIPVVYGYKKVAGTITFAETGADTNKYLWVAYVMSEGPVEGLHEVWIDNTQLPSALMPALNRGERVTVTGKDSKGVDCKFNNLTQLQFWNGGYFNTPSATNVGTSIGAGIFSGSPSWTNSMHYNGLVTVFARYEWPTDTTNNPFGGSIPKLEVCMLGRKVQTLTSGTPELYEHGQFLDGYTEAYSTNPAEILLDYLRHPRYGKGLVNNDIDWESFKRAAAKYNQQVTFISGATGPILRLDYVVNTGQTIFNNCKEMLSNCRSYLPFTQGRYKLIVEDAGNPTDITSGSAPIAATFNKDNIIGEITYTGIERSSKYNSVTVNYCEPANQWSNQSVTYPETFAERQALIDEDGGREYTGEFTFAGITNPGIAKDFARLILNKSRYQDAINLTVTSQGFELEPGDNIYIDANILKFGTDPLLNAIPWRIISIKLNNDYSFTLGCVRNPDFIYPHVRQGEIDYKYALYVPKGATRYYPPEPIGIPIGYNPPTSAPTNDSDAPPASTGVGQLVDLSELYDIKIVVKSGLVYATMAFNQPNNNAYLSTIVKYKQNSTTVTNWTTLEVTDKPGANQPIAIEIGPLTNNSQYYLTTQVKYTTLDLSTKTSTYTVNVAAQISTGSGGTATGGSAGSGGGTTPVTDTGATISPTNSNTFSSVIMATATSGGLPYSTRTLNITLRQDMSLGVNPNLVGVEVYSKPSQNPKWYKRTLTPTVTQGNDISFSMTVGDRLYPLVPGTSPTPAAADDWDFIFRFSYRDGTVSQYQYHATNCSVEYNGSSYSFNPLTTGSISNRELTSSYTPQVVDATDVIETRNLNLGIKSISNAISIGTQAIYFAFNTPSTLDILNWKGARLYWHQVGTANTWTSVDYVPVSTDVTGYYIGLNINYNVAYEYVIVPLVDYAGSTVEANQGRYISGAINNTSGYGDWSPYLNVQGLEAVATAKARIGSAPAGTPVRTTKFDSIDDTTLVTGGYPYNPRRVQFSIKQLVEASPNPRLAGIKIYYKRAGAVNYYEVKYPLPVGYTEGNTITFNSTQTTPAMELGAPNYPAALPATEDYQNYDFIIRWYYDDNSDSDFELNFTNLKGRGSCIERCATQYQFRFLGASGTVPGANWTNASSINTAKTNITTTTINNQTPNTVDTVTDITSKITPYILTSGVENGTNTLSFFGSSPGASLLPYFKSYRVLYRQITVGTNTFYNTADPKEFVLDTAVNYNGALMTDGRGIKIPNILWDQEYEMAIIPQVWNGTLISDATECFYVRGKFHNRTSETTGTNPYPDYRTGSNWLSKYPATKTLTATALSVLSTYPVSGFSSTAVTRVTSTGYNLTESARKYWKLSFNIPVGCKFNLYRRSVCVPTTTAKAFDPSSLWGYGRWEKISSNAPTNCTIDASGNAVIHVRPAISGLYEFYRSFYWASNNNATTNPLYDNPMSTTDTTVKRLVGDATTVGYYGYNISNGVIGKEATQFMIVITYDNGVSFVESTKAQLFTVKDAASGLYTDNPIDYTTATYTTTASATTISPLPSGIDISSSHANINNMKRTISEYRNLVASTSIKLGSVNAAYTVPTATPPVQ